MRGVVIYYLTFKQWLAMGLRKGYCSEEYCQTHDAGPITEAEEKEWNEGGDPCMFVVRLGSEKDWDNGYI